MIIVLHESREVKQMSLLNLKIIGILYENENSGKTIPQITGFFGDCRIPTIYEVLKRLETSGMVTKRSGLELRIDGRPPKIYFLTQKGVSFSEMFNITSYDKVNQLIAGMK